MKRFLPLLFFVAVTQFSQAQNLLNSHKGSPFTAIYQITAEELQELTHSKHAELKDSYFHSVVDYYSSDSVYQKKLLPGHYLHVKTLGDRLAFEVEVVNNLDMQILNNHRDLQLVFIDNTGHEIKSLKPNLKNKIIPLDKTLGVYRIATTNKQGIVSVEYEGHVNFFSLRRQYNNTFPARVHRRVFNTFPIRQITAPVRYVYRSGKSLIRSGHMSPPPIYYKIRNRVEGVRTFDGFMVLNKPKYKPGDTVKMKAYVTDSKGKPINRALDLHIGTWNYGGVSKKISALSPYRPGLYSFEFILADSLKLTLDHEYVVNLSHSDRSQYPSKTFYFEQYELKQNSFSVRAPETELTKTKPKIVFLKGTDSNDMPLYDVSVELLALTKSVKESYEKLLFVPDTLWRHTLKLDPLGETRATLPDSIFRNALMEVELTAIFRNAENETQSKSITLSYDGRQPDYTSTLEKDSIKFANAMVGESVTLIMQNKQGDVLETKNITLPYQEKVNQLAYSYEILKNNKPLSVVSLNQEANQLEVMAQRTRDSLHIKIQNPRKLTFRYQLFKGNQIVASGLGSAYAHKQSTQPNERFYLSIHITA